MYKQKLNEELQKIIVNKASYKIDEIFPHEKILKDRANGLMSYIESLRPWIIIPSILICSETNVIIDGHHRYYVLKKMNIDMVPVTLINYSSKKIITHPKENLAISKSKLLSAAKSKSLLEPKTSLHHISDSNEIYPIILISDLRLVKDE
tara:strand:+ start:776 stop:1225 length:450 start_codon:yes stop_codon:yes gene_type:complete